MDRRQTPRCQGLRDIADERINDFLDIENSLENLGIKIFDRTDDETLARYFQRGAEDREIRHLLAHRIDERGNDGGGNESGDDH